MDFLLYNDVIIRLANLLKDSNNVVIKDVCNNISNELDNRLKNDFIRYDTYKELCFNVKDVLSVVE